MCQLVLTWFLKIDLVWIISMHVVCVSPPPRLLITSGVIWASYDWIHKFLHCYMATLAISINGVALALIHVVETSPIRVS